METPRNMSETRRKNGLKLRKYIRKPLKNKKSSKMSKNCDITVKNVEKL